jgi:hypothetical protein
LHLRGFIRVICTLIVGRRHAGINHETLTSLGIVDAGVEEFAALDLADTDDSAVHASNDSSRYTREFC